MIRLGSMLEDIEAAFCVGYRFESYGDSESEGGYFFDDDAPWQTGIRGYIKHEPFLLSKYKTLMRYKRLSADFRDAVGLCDPNSATLLFERSDSDEEWLVPVRERAQRILAAGRGSFRLLSKVVSQKLLNLETHLHREVGS